MFRFRKTADVVTLFHKAGSPASTRVANLLKQASANAQSAATMDQASEAPKPSREPFELNITEDPPTADQVQTILEYVGEPGVSRIIRDARDRKDALQRFKQSKDSFLRPVTVDWDKGKAISGDNESEILRLLNARDKSDTT